MSIKLVALDMDGTLLDSNNNIPSDFMDWVKKHTDIKTVIASGRQYYALEKDFIPIKDKLIFAAENGGLVFKDNKIIYSNKMKKEDIYKCLDLVIGMENLTPIICGAEAAYIMPTKESIYKEASIYFAHLQQADDLYEAALHDTIVKIAVFVEDRRAELAMEYFKNVGKELAVVLSGNCWIDIINETSGKGTAITAIQEKYGISREESMAFGDYLNDAGMMKCCEESYCMENGHPDLKVLAKHIADSNDNNGVMKVLNCI